MTPQEAARLQAGQRVYWRDPDAGACSGVFLVETPGSGGPDNSIGLTDGAGGCTEALAVELFVCELCGGAELAPDECSSCGSRGLYCACGWAWYDRHPESGLCGKGDSSFDGGHRT